MLCEMSLVGFMKERYEYLIDEFGVELYSDNGVAHIAELCEPNAKSS